METARLSVSMFAIIFLLAMFGIGYEMGGYYSGATVMALAAASPHILNISRLYLPDFPQTAMTALALYFLLKTDGFRNRKFSIIFGIVLSFSFLTKWSTAFFIILPVFWFFVPIFFFPGNSLKTCLAFFLPACITVGGLTWYFYRISPHMAPIECFSRHWLLFYISFIVVPGIICIAMMILMEKKNKKEDNYGLTNFAFTSIIFAILTGPWYLWAASTLKEKMINDMSELKSLSMSGEILFSFFKTCFNLYPIFILFIIIGSIFMFIFRKERFYSRLLMLVNLVFVIFLVTRIDVRCFRYILSLVIFASALAGYWVCHTGRAKSVITAIVLLVSMFSILTWTFIPLQTMNLPIEEMLGYVGDDSYGAGKSPVIIFCSSPPPITPARYNLEPAIDLISQNNANQWKEIIIFKFEDFEFKVFGVEFLQLEAFRKGKKIEPRIQIDWEDYLRRAGNGHKFFDGFQFDRNRPSTEALIDDIIILHDRQQSEKQIIKEIERIMPGVALNIKTFNIGGGKQITLVNLKR